jgi:hypothetical protein
VNFRDPSLKNPPLPAPRCLRHPRHCEAGQRLGVASQSYYWFATPRKQRGARDGKDVANNARFTRMGLPQIMFSCLSLNKTRVISPPGAGGRQDFHH